MAAAGTEDESSLAALQAIQAHLSDRPPFVKGGCQLQTPSFRLAYGPSGRMINLANATPAELDDLEKACQPATFGLNDKDVLDETYRKAGKMDCDSFLTGFHLCDTGLLEIVQDELLDGGEAGKLQADLYKLNVYGAGSFFKAHKDTPRSQTMVASLVIVFPTDHDGGDLVLRHRGKEYSFEAAHILAKQSVPSIAYIAFFSDMEHEVMPVLAGHRVTLTYNLSLVAGPLARSRVPTNFDSVTSNTAALSAAIATLLKDPVFSREGGAYLGFGLVHEYPVPKNGELASDITSYLKGTDAMLYNVFRQFDSKARVVAMYKPDYTDRHRHLIMSQRLADPDKARMYEWSEDIVDGTAIVSLPLGLECYWCKRRMCPCPLEVAIPVVWVTPPSTESSLKHAYMAYGNDPSLDFLYGRFCLVADIKSG